MNTLTQYKLKKHRINSDITLKPITKECSHFNNWIDYIHDTVGLNKGIAPVIEKPFKVDINDPNFDKDRKSVV